MKNNYEAAELVVVGTAQDTILGMKDIPSMDNVPDPDMWHRADSMMFEE